MSEKVDLVGGCVLFALNLERMVNFYLGVAGLTQVANDKSYACLTANGFELMIQQIPSAIAASITIEDPPIPRESSPAKIVYRVADIATARTKAAALGGHLHDTDKQWEYAGMQVCDGWDPEGNIFQVRQSVS